MENKELRLRRFGENFYGQMVYQDVDTGRYYVDVDGVLHNCCPADDPDGEPEKPYDGDYTIVNPMTDREKREKLQELNYAMCDRISQDIRAFLFAGPGDCRYRNERMIFNQDIRSAMESLEDYWNKIPEDLKPEWLTKEEMESFRTAIAGL